MSEHGRLWWEGAIVAQLARGANALEPGVTLLADESMIEMANIEGQLRASNIRKLAEMVEKHPDESLNIMRGWMSQERA